MDVTKSASMRASALEVTSQSSQKNSQDLKNGNLQCSDAPASHQHLKTLDNRSGIMKCRALGMLGKSSKNDPRKSNESGTQSSSLTGGQFFFRGLSSTERERISRSRAAELSALYELNDSKDTSLNRNAEILPFNSAFTPNLAAHMLNLKQVVKLVSQESDESLSEVATATYTLCKTSSSFEENNATVSEPARKVSVEVPRPIRNKLGFPKWHGSTSRLEIKRPLRNEESRDDNENRIPNHIQYDSIRAKNSLADKASSIIPNVRTTPNQYTNVSPFASNRFVVPELC